MESLRNLAERAGMELTDEELAELLPIYDHCSRQAAILHDLNLGRTDLAVTFLPGSVDDRTKDLSQ
jgi:hypothetical protein